jgi:DNA/RNA endonuclease YhcR with UshA esterase domain
VTLQGKVIGITGTVEMYKGRPEIKVLSREQITGADSQPVKR